MWSEAKFLLYRDRKCLADNRAVSVLDLDSHRVGSRTGGGPSLGRGRAVVTECRKARRRAELGYE